MKIGVEQKDGVHLVSIDDKIACAVTNRGGIISYDSLYRENRRLRPYERLLGSIVELGRMMIGEDFGYLGKGKICPSNASDFIAGLKAAGAIPADRPLDNDGRALAPALSTEDCWPGHEHLVYKSADKRAFRDGWDLGLAITRALRVIARVNDLPDMPPPSEQHVDMEMFRRFAEWERLDAERAERDRLLRANYVDEQRTRAKNLGLVAE